MPKKGILTILLFIMSALPALAITDATGPWGVRAEAFTNLSSALSSTSTLGKKIVVSSPMTINSESTDRAIEVIKGGLIIVASGKTFTVSGPFSAGQYQVFAGSGTVSGLKNVYPEWFGATPGVIPPGANQTAIRTANLAAINTAWGIVRYTAGGILNINQPYEVTGGSVLLGSKTSPPTDEGQSFIRPAIKGNGVIRSYYTGVAVDAIGMRLTTIEDITIESNTATVGLLLGRSSGTVANNGSDRSDGTLNSFNRLRIMGSFSNANLVTVSSESNRYVDCFFYNVYPGASSYRSSDNKDTLGVESSTYGPMWASTNTTGASLVDAVVHQAEYFNPLATNTEQKFTGSVFYGYGNRQNVVELNTAYSGVFESCMFISGAQDSTNLVKFVAGPVASPVNSFGWGLTFNNCHFEIMRTDTMSTFPNVFYFDYIGSGPTYVFKGININNSFFATNTSITAYKDIKKTQLHKSTWSNIFTIGGLQINLPLLVQSNIDIPTTEAHISGGSSSSKIRAASVTWDDSAPTIGAQSITEDINRGVMQYGVVPSSIRGATNPFADARYRSRLVIGPVINRSYLLSDPPPLKGELIAFDSSAVFPGATTSGGVNMGFFDGVDFRPLGLNVGSVASSSSSGVANTMVYNGNYLYICTATGTEGNLRVGSGSINTGSIMLTLVSGTITPGSYITIAGVKGIKRVEASSIVNITLDSASDATVTAAAVAYAVPKWKRISYDASW